MNHGFQVLLGGLIDQSAIDCILKVILTFEQRCPPVSDETRVVSRLEATEPLGDL